MDSGCRTTSICSAGRSNSQWASMTSRALFISVAESMVIFRPICQVGWLRACSTVACSTFSAGQSRSAPPEAVMTTFSTSSALTGGQALEDGRVLAVHRQDGHARRTRRGHDDRAGHHQRFLVGDGQGRPALDGRQRRGQARRAHHAREQNVRPAEANQLGHGLRAGQHLGQVPHFAAEALGGLLVGNGHNRRTKLPRLLRQQPPIAPRRQAQTSRPAEAEMTSRPCRPMLPVEPSMATRFTPIEYPQRSGKPHSPDHISRRPGQDKRKGARGVPIVTPPCHIPLPGAGQLHVAIRQVRRAGNCGSNFGLWTWFGARPCGCRLA